MHHAAAEGVGIIKIIIVVINRASSTRRPPCHRRREILQSPQLFDTILYTRFGVFRMSYARNGYMHFTVRFISISFSALGNKTIIDTIGLKHPDIMPNASRIVRVCIALNRDLSPRFINFGIIHIANGFYTVRVAITDQRFPSAINRRVNTYLQIPPRVCCRIHPPLIWERRPR